MAQLCQVQRPDPGVRIFLARLRGIFFHVSVELFRFLYFSLIKEDARQVVLSVWVTGIARQYGPENVLGLSVLGAIRINLSEINRDARASAPSGERAFVEGFFASPIAAADKTAETKRDDRDGR